MHRDKIETQEAIITQIEREWLNEWKLITTDVENCRSKVFPPSPPPQESIEQNFFSRADRAELQTNNTPHKRADAMTCDWVGR